MHKVLFRIFFVLTVLSLYNPSCLATAAERRIALVIGNSSYSSSPLKNSENDAADMADQLQKLGFKVILKNNVGLRDMEDALTDFGNQLKLGGVGLFFFAGHGLQVGGVNYLVPIKARINREADIKYETLDAGKILDEMAAANNGLNIVILDACRDNPYSRNFRSTSRGLAIVGNAPAGTFISYSTSPGNIASDGDGRNSPYTKALLQYMKEPGLTIEQVFKNVRARLGKETGGKQIPWELSSLQGEFYFTPGNFQIGKETVQPKIVPAGDSATVFLKSDTDALDEEYRKLDDEEHQLQKEKALLEKKKSIDEKRRKIQEEKAALEEQKEKILALGKLPSAKSGVLELDSANDIQIINVVPKQKSSNFSKNLRTDLKVDTWVFDHTPYFMTFSATKVILKSPRTITLAGDRQGVMPWEVDNFLLLEILDSSGTILKRAVVGYHDDISAAGNVIEKIGSNSFSFPAGAIDVTHLFPVNQQITLKVSAMDYGFEGHVSNIFLIIK